MFADNDLDFFLADFGVSVTDGVTTTKGILDMPSEVLAGDQVISVDYSLTIKAGIYPSLTYGSPLTVDGGAYQVRRVTNESDGRFVTVHLQKV